MADHYQTEEVQLVLFEGFFADGEKDQSRTLDIYDALPKFSLSWAREGGMNRVSESSITCGFKTN